jgi:hypothetical protein
MRALSFTLLAVLSYVAVIGATPLEVRASAEVIDRRQGSPVYVISTHSKWRGSYQIGNLSPAHHAF